MKKNLLIAAAVVLVAVWLIGTRKAYFRVDMTEEGRYSLSEATQKQLKAMKEPLTMKLYLCGDLDANMLKLKRGVEEMVGEMNMKSAERIEIVEVDPNEAKNDDQRYRNYNELEIRGLRGMSVTHRERNGAVKESVVFPWAELCSKNDTMAICLMQGGNAGTGEAGVNSSLEDLEFQIIDAVRVLNRDNVKKIAFLEGHGELEEMYTYDITMALSRYFQVDRGEICSDPTVLDPYSCVIIAKPMEKFSEIDKFTIDQYIMRGGSVLWLLDGVVMSDTMLSMQGMTPLVANELNLNDQLFRYGVRLTYTVVEDMQCAYMPVNMSRKGEQPRFEPIPWTFMPQLQVSPYHPSTKSVSDVCVKYASGIEIVGDSAGIKKEILMVSSNASHVSWAPSEIDVMQAIKVEPQEYFVNQFIPVGVALEGEFMSIYSHRMPPAGLDVQRQVVDRSQHAKMIVVGDGDVIKNEIQRSGEGVMCVPVGFDRVTQQMHGNRDFIINAVLYLTDDEGVMELRKRHLDLRLLNRTSAEQWIGFNVMKNILLPLVLLGLARLLCFVINKRKYGKKRVR